MKKKFLLAAVLVGALSLGSCVDDKESQSVTEVRNAKAEQLRGVANYQNALAEATKLNAQSEAEYKAAYAEYYKAQAEYQKALTAYKDAETAAKKAELEATIAKAAADKAKWEAELQRIQAQLERDLQSLQNELLTLKATYLNNLSNLSDAEKKQFTKLMTDYNTEAQALIRVQSELATAQATLRNAEAGLATTQETKDKLILANEKQIAENNKTIAKNQAKIDVYSKYTNSAEAEAALSAAETTLLDLEQKEVTAQEAQNKTATAVDAAAEKIDINIILDILNDPYLSDEDKKNKLKTKSQFLNLLATNDLLEGQTLYEINLVADEDDDNVGFEVTEKGKTTFTALYTKKQTKQIVEKVVLGEGTIPVPMEYDSIKSMYVLNDKGFEAFFALAAENLKNTDAVKTAKEAADAAAKALKEVNDKVAELDGAIKTLKGLSETADVADAIADLESQLAEEKAKLPDLKKTSEDATKAYNDEVAAAEKNVEQLDETKAAYKELVAAAPAFQKLVAAVNTANEANMDAKIASEKATFAKEQQQAVVNALDLAASGENAKTKIEALERENAQLEADNAQLQKEIDSIEDITTAEQAIAEAKANVERLESKLAAQQKVTDAAKKALEDAINATEE